MIPHEGPSDNEQQKKSLLMSLIRVFGKEFLVASGIKLIVDCLQFVEPQLVEKLTIFVRDKDQEIEIGFIISILFFITAFVKEQIYDHPEISSRSFHDSYSMTQRHESKFRN